MMVDVVLLEAEYDAMVKIIILNITNIIKILCIPMDKMGHLANVL